MFRILNTQALIYDEDYILSPDDKDSEDCIQILRIHFTLEIGIIVWQIMLIFWDVSISFI